MSGGGYRHSLGSISDVESESDPHTLTSIINKDWILPLSPAELCLLICPAFSVENFSFEISELPLICPQSLSFECPFMSVPTIILNPSPFFIQCKWKHFILMETQFSCAYSYLYLLCKELLAFLAMSHKAGSSFFKHLTLSLKHSSCRRGCVNP